MNLEAQRQQSDVTNRLNKATNKANALGNAFANTFGKPSEVGIQSELDVTIEKIKSFENVIKKTEGSAASLQKEIGTIAYSV